MKKLILFLVLLVSVGYSAQAQFSLGIKGGLSSSGVDVKNAKNTINQLKDADNITGYHLGVFTRAKFNNFFLQPEAYFATSGGRLKQTDLQNNTIDEVKARFTRLDVPVMAGFSFLKVARVQAGPVASVLVGSKIGDQRIKDYLNKTDWGFQVGAGLDISNLTLDVRYENINRDYTNQDSSFDLKNQQVIVSLGIKLIGK
ncbi:PorT family protein [Adhaeribacter swui]|uniref:PorT family protein n=1 Tax=Adhaeribacter swui TaxID=2086471 RepID=A0A7G7G8J8_9BACT|nr:porin family protein [Adhaeribacter swui]QNF33482.1 PorT family protein [Adhaeribacter swui]